MLRVSPKNCFALRALALALVLQAASCGTLLHPERRGQPVGRLDPAIVVLDAVGLIFFFVPGIIAFAVDFSTGAIYLPPERYYILSNSSPASEEGELQTIKLDPAKLTPSEIERIVREKTGRQVVLEPGKYQAAPIRNAEELTPTAWERLKLSLRPSNVIFRGSSQ